MRCIKHLFKCINDLLKQWEGREAKILKSLEKKPPWKEKLRILRCSFPREIWQCWILESELATKETHQQSFGWPCSTGDTNLEIYRASTQGKRTAKRVAELPHSIAASAHILFSQVTCRGFKLTPVPHVTAFDSHKQIVINLIDR